MVTKLRLDDAYRPQSLVRSAAKREIGKWQGHHWAMEKHSAEEPGGHQGRQECLECQAPFVAGPAAGANVDARRRFESHNSACHTGSFTSGSSASGWIITSASTRKIYF